MSASVMTLHLGFGRRWSATGQTVAWRNAAGQVAGRVSSTLFKRCIVSRLARRALLNMSRVRFPSPAPARRPTSRMPSSNGCGAAIASCERNGRAIGRHGIRVARPLLGTATPSGDARAQARPRRGRRRGLARVGPAAGPGQGRSRSTTGRTTSIRRCSRTSRPRPASRWSTTSSTATTSWRPSCSPAAPATIWWCRRTISSAARSRPASSSRSTESKIPNWSNLDPDLMAKVAAYDPDNEHAMIYMWGTTGLAYNVDKVKERLPDAPTDSWTLLFDPANRRRSSPTAASWCSIRRPTSCRAPCDTSARTRTARIRRCSRKVRRWSRRSALHPQVPQLGEPQRARQWRHLPVADLLRRRRHRQDARRGGQERGQHRVRDPARRARRSGST